MPENFGNSLLGLGVFLVLMWVWTEPEKAGQWVNDFRSVQEGRP